MTERTDSQNFVIPTGAKRSDSQNFVIPTGAKRTDSQNFVIPTGAKRSGGTCFCLQLHRTLHLSLPRIAGAGN
jgi:hypothetical protein